MNNPVSSHRRGHAPAVTAKGSRWRWRWWAVRAAAHVGLAMFIACLPLAPAAAAELRVKVRDLRSNAGNVHFALYATPESFPNTEGQYAGTQVLVRSLEAVAVFTGLKAGRYAVAVYHDENGNGEFDQGFLGIPLEGFGFSNGAVAIFRAPRFHEAAIELDGEVTEITIPMIY